MIIAATGHRPDKLGGYGNSVFQRLIVLATSYLERQRPEKVISGMAQGWDQAVAVASYALGIPYIAAIPCEGQERLWPADSQKRYREILRFAESIHVVAFGYSASVMQKRNEWMVDRADRMVALWDGSWGGTYNCVVYARKKRIPITNLWSEWCGGDEIDTLLTV